MTLIGYHGTKLDKIDSIQKNGFYCKPSELSKVGRVGWGAYFWYKYDDERLSINLSREWCVHIAQQDTLPRRTYCCVIVEIKANDDSFIDLLEIELRERLWRICKEHNIDINNWELVGKAYSQLIEEMEVEMKLPITVYKVQVTTPKKDSSFPAKIMGQPICLVVRDNSAIHIIRIQNF